MDFKRKIMNELLEWKEDKNKKALIIKGLRQVGKTYIVNKFAKENYEHVVYINFKNNDDIKPVFQSNLNIDCIILDLSAMIKDAEFVPYKTLIIMDEIQECSNARASLKPFVEDGRFDVIATGSLLGIRGYNKKLGQGIPTGSEHIIEMKSMDFEEFLWAKGISDAVINELKDSFYNRRMISPALHQRMLRYFKEYICVGGLPNVVRTFLENNSMKKVLSVQNDLLQEYQDDFGKHLNDNEKEVIDSLLLARIEEVYSSLCYQLGKENKKFQYSVLKTNGRSDDYRKAIQWLVDSGLVVQCFNLSLLELPLEGNKMPDCFKLYLADCGLFVAMLEEGSQNDILQGNLGIYKGAVFEEMIADAFYKNNKKLYYYRNNNGSEVDFIIRYQNKPTLVEVKATSGNIKSSKTILANYDKYHVDQCIKLGEYNIGYQSNILTMPYYLAFLL